MEDTLARIIAEQFSVEITPQITRPEPQFGDFATNVALQLAGRVGKSPREVAEQLAEALRQTGEFAEVTVAGPGFINVRLANGSLENQLESMHEGYGKPDTYAGKTIITEYSDPNPFKVLHAGHFYTSVVGDAMSRLIEFAGGTVHRVNFGGDVGMHVAKTMWAILQKLGGEHPEKLNDIPSESRSEWMAEQYVIGTDVYEDDEAARADIVALNKKVYQLHSDNDHESALAQIYWTCRQWSYDYFTAFYARIGTNFERYIPESETAPLGLATVREQQEKGVYTESDGAVVFVGEPYGLHTRVFINAEGLPTYEAKDVGLSIKKWNEYSFDQSIIITGNDITEYMKVVLKSIEQFQSELAHRTLHVTHGNVKLPGGVKMSSRKGNILRAVDVLSSATEATEAIQPGSDESVVLGAIKYAFLKNRVGPDVIFDVNESVALHGNSGPYLQYAHARASSLLQKGTAEPALQGSDFDEAERSLLVKLTEFPEIMQAAAAQLAPHLVCTYAYELTQVFNRFYEQSRIIGDGREAHRLKLVQAYALILKQSLSVLGIAAPETL